MERGYMEKPKIGLAVTVIDWHHSPPKRVKCTLQSLPFPYPPYSFCFADDSGGWSHLASISLCRAVSVRATVIASCENEMGTCFGCFLSLLSSFYFHCVLYWALSVHSLYDILQSGTMSRAMWCNLIKWLTIMFEHKNVNQSGSLVAFCEGL